MYRWTLLAFLGLVSIAQCQHIARGYKTILYDYLDPTEYFELDDKTINALQDGLYSNKENSIQERVRSFVQSGADPKHVWQSLLTLIDHDTDSIEGLENVVELMKSIRFQRFARHKFGEHIKLTSSGHFLFGIEKEKFNKWAAIAEYNLQVQDIAVFEKFDPFFYQALNVAEISEERKKTKEEEEDDDNFIMIIFNDLLDGFDMTRENLDARSLLEAANGGKFGMLVSRDDRLEPLITFMDANCEELMKYKTPIEIVHMAMAIGSRQIESADVHRLSEYYRICLAWRKPDTNIEILNNIDKKMDEQGVFGALRKCLDF